MGSDGEGFPLTNRSTYMVIQLFIYKCRWLYTKVNAFVALTAGLGTGAFTDLVMVSGKG